MLVVFLNKKNLNYNKNFIFSDSCNYIITSSPLKETSYLSKRFILTTFQQTWFSEASKQNSLKKNFKRPLTIEDARKQRLFYKNETQGVMIKGAATLLISAFPKYALPIQLAVEHIPSSIVFGLFQSTFNIFCRNVSRVTGMATGSAAFIRQSLDYTPVEPGKVQIEYQEEGNSINNEPIIESVSNNKLDVDISEIDDDTSTSVAEALISDFKEDIAPLTESFNLFSDLQASSQVQAEVLENIANVDPSLGVTVSAVFSFWSAACGVFCSFIPVEGVNVDAVTIVSGFSITALLSLGMCFYLKYKNTDNALSDVVNTSKKTFLNNENALKVKSQQIEQLKTLLEQQNQLEAVDTEIITNLMNQIL